MKGFSTRAIIAVVITLIASLASATIVAAGPIATLP